MLGPSLDGDEQGEGDGGGREQHQHQRLSPADLTTDAQAEQRGDGGGGERDGARVVDRLARQAGRLVQDRDRDHQRDQRDRRLQQEDRAPADGVDEWTAGHEPQHRRTGADERPPTHRLHPVFFGERPHDQRHRRRAGGGARDGAERADRDERRAVPRKCRQEGGDGEAGETDDVHAPMAAHVADLAEQRHRQRQGEERPGDRPGERGLARTKVTGDVAERDGEDRDREAGCEQPGKRGPQDPPAVAVALADVATEAPAQQHRPRDGGNLLAAWVLDDERRLGVTVHRPGRG